MHLLLRVALKYSMPKLYESLELGNGSFNRRLFKSDMYVMSKKVFTLFQLELKLPSHTPVINFLLCREMVELPKQVI